ncbi:hypothetical protein J8L98_13405 [Pseudoalteromonas sp. MMG013]|uniref:hypothetical protein n=1 Tax=Pseudoalteromonas sp. MMG013 TaxID=2822687 RepID=UPI001B37F050|nr:hypothetical protein [Pseudoalteromonas sp. MMG013]MBQ4862687.1 hypothetical protein [Pseudoalteromonas sp. MMG013]
MKVSNLILLSIFSILIFYIQLWDHRVVTPLYILLLGTCVGYGVYTKNINMKHIALFLLVIHIIDYSIFEAGLIDYITPYENQLIRGTLIFGTQLIISIGTVLVLILRVQLSRIFSKSKSIALTHFDGIFHWLYIYLSAIYFVALLENIAWSYFDMKSWTFIYDNFEGLIYTAWALCCGTLLAMMITSTKSNYHDEEAIS